MDENFSLDVLYTNDDVPEELYELVRQGLDSQLNTRLHELPNSMEYLTTLTYHSQGRLSLLMIAALNGYDEVVRVLLTHCDPIHQIELKGQIKLSDKETINGATALYCACYREHFTVAKTLIELGNAHINQRTYDYPCYPLLLHATIMNRIDIVRFLIENKYSDVNETKSTDYGQCTALICAASHGYISLVKYLINHGANVNYTYENIWTNVETPLLCAIIGGHTEVAQLLYEAGANLTFKNDLNDFPLRKTIENRSFLMINFLLERCIYTVEDLEFAACSLVHVSSSIEQLHETLEILKISLQQRELMSIPKVCISPIAAYDYKQECQTIDELNSIRNNRNRILIETLLIRERIFHSRHGISIIKPLHDYGDMLVDREEFDKCLDLWIHMFYLYQPSQRATILHRFIWLFCRMFTANQRISIERFLQVCQLIFEPSQMEDKSLTGLNALFLLIIAARILEQEGISREEQTSIYCWIKDFCRHQWTAVDGRTLLHFCVDGNTTELISFRPMDIVQYLEFPNVPALRLLLTFGSRWLDVDAIESTNGDTPLHLICQGNKDQQIIKLLLNSGCHIDCVNKYGIIPMDLIKDKNTRALFMPKPTPWNLKCLCARIIANKQFNTESLKVLSTKLKRFIILHGGNSYIPSDSN